MRTRISHNIDLTDFEPIYGLQVNMGNGWMHAVDNEKMITSKDKSVIEAKRKEIKKRAREMKKEMTDA